MLRVLVAIGTRPEAIKLAPVVDALSKTEGVEVRVCLTAQHRQMLDHTLAVFGLTGDVDLDVMRENQDLAALTATLLKGTRETIRAEAPDLVLVQGDTTTVFATSLAAYYEGVAVGHVEAGLRTGDLRRPFPEEANRRLTAVLADLHFAPTEGAKENLEAEGIDPARIHVTGNTVVDALEQTVARLARDPKLRATADAPLPALPEGRRLILVTGHRRESFGGGFAAICDALAGIAGRHPELDIVYPVHLNPKVREPVHARLSRVANVHLLAPVDYLSFVRLLERSYLVVTDSGGVQEEAPALGKPVLVMREKTERPEAIAAGTARLVGTDAPVIEAEVERLLTDAAAYRAMSSATNPFGDGRAAARIRDAILAWKDAR